MDIAIIASDTKKELMEKHEEFNDNIEKEAKDDVESVLRGEGESVVK